MPTTSIQVSGFSKNVSNLIQLLKKRFHFNFRYTSPLIH
jgi:hypothetical protein